MNSRLFVTIAAVAVTAASTLTAQQQIFRGGVASSKGAFHVAGVENHELLSGTVDLAALALATRDKQAEFEMSVAPARGKAGAWEVLRVQPVEPMLLAVDPSISRSTLWKVSTTPGAKCAIFFDVPALTAPMLLAPSQTWFLSPAARLVWKGLADTQGRALVKAGLPRLPALVGMPITAQMLTVDPLGRIEVSAPLALKVQP